MNSGQPPPPIRPGQFQCPICGAGNFEQFQIPGPVGAQLYFSCIGCTALFRNPWQFTAIDPSGYQMPNNLRHIHDPRELQVRNRALRLAEWRLRQLAKKKAASKPT